MKVFLFSLIKFHANCSDYRDLSTKKAQRKVGWGGGGNLLFRRLLCEPISCPNSGTCIVSIALNALLMRGVN